LAAKLIFVSVKNIFKTANRICGLIRFVYLACSLCTSDRSNLPSIGGTCMNSRRFAPSFSAYDPKHYSLLRGIALFTVFTVLCSFVVMPCMAATEGASQVSQVKRSPVAGHRIVPHQFPAMPVLNTSSPVQAIAAKAAPQSVTLWDEVGNLRHPVPV
jgi:hypothetical protein